VVVLAGGTGGAKLARGMADIVGDDLVVIANTADDTDVHGASVSPDPDLVSFWLADRIDERGWGLDGDTFEVMDMLRELGVDVWFNLGDRDLAWCIERRRQLDAGRTPTQALAALLRGLGVTARVLPMCDEPVRTRVLARDSWFGFQEFMIRERAVGPVDGVTFDGIDHAAPTAEVLAAITSARAIIIGPSNPVISIGPILSVPGMTDALRDARAPVVAVSPIVGGAVLKGPTAAFMTWAGLPLGAAGIARAYAPIVDGILADEDHGVAGVTLRVANTLMADAGGRREVAQSALDLASELAA
jgi:LPPG:FO 2-phospho-L-lactate transferase